MNTRDDVAVTCAGWFTARSRCGCGQSTVDKQMKKYKKVVSVLLRVKKDEKSVDGTGLLCFVLCSVLCLLCCCLCSVSLGSRSIERAEGEGEGEQW